MLIKLNYFKILSYILFFTAFVSTRPLTALTIENLTKASQIKSYQKIENINKVPLKVKIEQLLFLGWNIQDINDQTLQYLSNHNIGGITIVAKDLIASTSNQIASFTAALKQSPSIPCFINVSSSSLSYFCFSNYQQIQKTAIKKSKNAAASLIAMGVNTTSIPKMEIKVSSTANLNETQKSYYYQAILSFVKTQNKNGIVTMTSNFEYIDSPNNGNTTAETAYISLINKTSFNQIIVPINKKYNEEFYSLSKSAITNDIKNNLNFTGVVVNNSLSDKTIVSNYPLENIIIKAILAGNNMIFYNGGDLKNNQAFVSKVTAIITKAINNKTISIDDINASYIKVINLKTQFAIIKKEQHC